MGPLTILFEIISVAGFLVGCFTDNRAALVFPASFAVSVILMRWVVTSRVKHTKVVGIKLDGRNPKDKAKLDNFLSMMKEMGVDLPPPGEKCKDPHCENCWGLGDKPEL